MMEFWNDIATDRSWKALISLGKGFDFILIGGWACYLLTKAVKSKDIDIIADFEALGGIREKYGMKKNPKLKKYETVVDEISVDIYVPHYSEFPISPGDMMKNTVSIEGFRVVRPEVLLLLKQRAEMNRHDSVKGQKDRVDIISLLLKSDIDKKLYVELVRKNNLSDFLPHLRGIVMAAKKEFLYLGIENPREIKLIKRDLLKGLD